MITEKNGIVLVFFFCLLRTSSDSSLYVHIRPISPSPLISQNCPGFDMSGSTSAGAPEPGYDINDDGDNRTYSFYVIRPKGAKYPLKPTVCIWIACVIFNFIFAIVMG